MKSFISRHLRGAGAFLLLALLAGCTSAPDSVSGASESARWRISLGGFRQGEFTSWEYDQLYDKSPLGRSFETVKKGETRVYQGVPLYTLIALVDDSEGRKFNRDLWKEGYDVTLTSRDGYSVTFTSSDIDPDVLLLCEKLNGELQPPTVAGDVSSKYWVKDLASIELGLQGATTETFSMRLEVGAVEYDFSIPELEKSEFYWEERGGYTTSAGTHYEGIYGGVRVSDFLKVHAALKPGQKVVVTAMDGYEMTYSSDELLDETEGVWTLAFKLDGEYLPEDPGYIRTIKLGPDNPNIEGHSSARMVHSIKVEKGAYREFSLSVEGEMDRVLDRSTVESGVSCHRSTVSYTKKGITNTFVGIPLWRLLAYGDDPKYAPHKQDSSIISYNAEAAEKGYKVELIAQDGFRVSLDSRFAHENDKLILAMYEDDGEIRESHWPLRLVWDDSLEIPEGLKSIGQVSRIVISR